MNYMDHRFFGFLEIIFTKMFILVYDEQDFKYWQSAHGISIDHCFWISRHGTSHRFFRDFNQFQSDGLDSLVL